MQQYRKPLIIFIAILILGLALTLRYVWIHAQAFNQEMHALTTLDFRHGLQDKTLATAKTHLTNASAELDSLRPVARPTTFIVRQLINLPLIGSHAAEFVALWSFADGATHLGLDLVHVIELGLPYQESEIDMTSVVEIAPVAQEHLQSAETNFKRANAARAWLQQMTWIPDESRENINMSLQLWDTFAADLGVLIPVANQTTLAITEGDALTHAKLFSTEFGQAIESIALIGETPSVAFLETRRHLAAAQTELDSIRPYAERSIPLITDLSDESPFASPLKTIANMWIFADSTTALGQTLMTIAELGYINWETDGFAGLVAIMPTIQTNFEHANHYFNHAELAREGLTDITWLPDAVETELQISLTMWDEYAPQLKKALSSSEFLMKILPALFSNKQSSDYLLLIQSTDELRATGGFITGIGTLKIKNGQITAVDIGEVGEFEVRAEWSTRLGYLNPEGRIDPPEPFKRYMGLGHWVLRDANWWADFPTTARQVAEFWQDSQGESVDGVIAINEQGVLNLLAGMGEVNISSGAVTDENLKAISFSRIYQGSNPQFINQSLYFQELSDAFLTGLQQLNPQSFLAFGDSIQQSVERHDILITSFDSNVATSLKEAGIDGGLQGDSDDYIYLVEDNMSYNKLSPFIQHNIVYEVELNRYAKPTLSILTIDKVNTYNVGHGLQGYPEGYAYGGRWNQDGFRLERWEGYYGGYNRIYMPVNSQVLGTNGFDDEPNFATESERTVIGGYTGLWPDDQHQIQVWWVPNVQQSVPFQYKLVVQRQPGAADHPLSIRVDLPDTTDIIHITPEPDTVMGNAIFWNVSLSQDQTFLISLAPTEDMPDDELQAMATAVPDSSMLPSITPTTKLAEQKPTPVPDMLETPQATYEHMPEPARMRIPALGLDAPIVSVGLEPSGIMASPEEAHVVGWYKFGPRPGEASNAILAGHVDWMGEIGVFAYVADMKVGQTIDIEDVEGHVFRYTVAEIDVYEADKAPIVEIFGGTERAAITLITCTGPIDTLSQRYRDRIVVRAFIP